ncbi:polysaccharide biosynthesis/export family protein [Novosphingobium beihaiensis]|uniref:Polysaccharide export protein n=1 Tax=Novosphingobium beihaiensis TaxID=2930389 RepID=A0ABT0BU49_9SPHN|nr:polysaccharide biosynthesis/export family protein [Novosphingobium beihaiensis]MCJ2188356.1 polysaccharide export protein [Novosphingobium beihaiensis]
MGMSTALAGCAGNIAMGGDGPSLGRIKKVARGDHINGRTALLLGINSQIAKKLAAATVPESFGTTFGEGHPYGSVIGPGDVLQVSIFEAPPAVLFAFSASLTSAAATTGGQHGVALPEIEVDQQGRIAVPFAGNIQVLGLTPQQAAAQIVARLKGKAHNPQVLVSRRGEASAVTVVGQVRASMRMPLTSRGERVLDAIAAAGGPSEPVDKVSLEVTREGRTIQMPMNQVISSPKDNIYLRPGDVLTVSYQPRSFTVLGATGRNDEIKFEARGITLAQALGRIGGLRDDRANPGGLFVFRLEDAQTMAAVLPGADLSGLTDASGKVPVIYRADLRDPATFFAAQHFMVQDQDIVYVTNAPVADLQKFVNIIGAAIYPLVTVQAAGL